MKRQEIIEEIINQMNEAQNGTGPMLEDWYHNYTKNPLISIYEDRIIGFLWGLNATGYINHIQVGEAFDQLHDIMKKYILNRSMELR